MTVHTVRTIDEITPITFATDAGEVALAVYDRLLMLLEQLGPEEWSAPTDCGEWDVADIVRHLVGAARANASVREAVRQQVWAVRHKQEFGGNDLDAMNALQVRDHAHLGPHDLVEMLRSLAPKAVRGRMRFPRPLRGVRVPLAQTGSTAAGMPTSLALGHLMEVIYSRDLWMHRVDIATATGRTADVDRDADGRIVEDVVAEWARRHGQPFHLVLTGAAGGAFAHGEGGTRIEHDAVEFCRILSGRAPAEALLATRVLF